MKQLKSFRHNPLLQSSSVDEENLFVNKARQASIRHNSRTQREKLTIERTELDEK